MDTILEDKKFLIKRPTFTFDAPFMSSLRGFDQGLYVFYCYVFIMIIRVELLLLRIFR